LAAAITADSDAEHPQLWFSLPEQFDALVLEVFGVVMFTLKTL